MKTSYPAVLILGVVPSLTWLVARCIQRAGGSPVVLGWHALSPMQASLGGVRYLRWHGVRKLGGELDPAALAQVRAVCDRFAIDCVLGADYDTTLLLAAHGRAAGIPACPVPPAAAVTTFNNKWNLTRLADALGLPVPDSEYAADERDLLATRLAFPIITKPLDLWASVGVRMHRSRAELEQCVAQGKLGAPYPLIVQECVPGLDAGGSFLAQGGKLVAWSAFHTPRDRRRRFVADERVRGYLEQFAEATNYSGVGHIDLRYDTARDSYRILELNPRFWASLLYAANAGLNYPDLLVHLPQGRVPARAVADAREVRLPLYEAAMTVANRWFAAGFERLTGATL